MYAAEPYRIMFRIQTSRSAFFVTVLAITLGVEKCCAGSLITTPPAIEGVLTSCGEARLTCSHDNVDEENTRWRIGTAMDSSSVCEVTINHLSTIPVRPYSCSEFRFEDITELSEAANSLNSTAVVNPLPLRLNGTLMKCFAGTLSTSPLVGGVTLCVIGDVSARRSVSLLCVTLVQ